MATLKVRKTVQVPVETAWRLLARDFADIHRFHPAVGKSYAVGTAGDTAVGAERVCEFYDGNEARERVNHYVENEELGIEVVNSSFPVSRFEATFALATCGANCTEVTITGEFEPKGLMKIMTPVMKSKFEKLLGRLIDSLELHATTGQLIGNAAAA